MKRSQRIVRCVFVLLSLVFLAPQAARPAATKQDSTSRRKKLDVEKRKKEVKLFLDKIEILGRIDKPQTVFIVQGKDPTVEDIRIDRSFFKEIFRKVEKDDIEKIARGPIRGGGGKPGGK